MLIVSAITVVLKKNASTHCTVPVLRFATGKADIGGLPGRADDAGEINEVAVIGRLAAGEIQTAMFALDFTGVVVMGIVLGKHHLGEGP